MEIKRKDDVQYLEPELFTNAGMTAHGFTTRRDGVSRGAYNSLNLGTNTNDFPHHVEGNRSLVARTFGTTVENLLTVQQVHGTDLLVIDSPNPDYAHFGKLQCDGIVTNQKNLMIGILVADCVPLLLLDPKKGVVAALHAGWKGTAGNIAAKGVKALVEVFGSKEGDILAAIGPAIGSCCYQVDEPVIEAFRKQGGGFERFAAEDGEGKWRLDLAGANMAQLMAAGIRRSNIDKSDTCVSCTPYHYYSYRRDNGDTGRQMGFVMLRK